MIKIFKELLPTVKIRKVSLIPAGGSSTRGDRSGNDRLFAHIDESEGLGTPEGLTGPGARIDLLRPIVPGPGGLKVVVNFVVIETIPAGKLSGWLWDAEFGKFIRLSVALITDQEMGDRIFSSMGATSNSTLEEIAQFDQTFQRAVYGNEHHDGNKVDSRLQIKTKGTDQNDLMPRDAAAAAGNNDYVPDKKFNSDGTLTYSVPFRMEFDLETTNPAHLSVVAYPYFAINDIIEAYDLDPSTLPAGSILGNNVVIENYIDKGSLNSRGILYFTDTNPAAIWTGPAIHYAAGSPSEKGNVGWVGQFDESREVKLRREIINNNKVQDFRVREEIQKRKVDFSEVNSILDQQEAIRQARNLGNTSNQISVISRASGPDDRVMEKIIPKAIIKGIVRHEPSFFSDAMISRDSVNNCRFMFAIDYNKIIKEKTAFGTVFSTATLKNHVKIKGLNILRKRIDPTVLNTIIPNKADWNDFNKEVAVDTIVTAKEYSGASLLMPIAQSYTGDVEQRTGKFKRRAMLYEEQIYTIGDAGYRYFCVEDYEMSDMTDGVYQYGVELLLEDNTTQIALNYISQLRIGLKVLKDYYELAKIPQTHELVPLIHISADGWNTVEGGPRKQIYKTAVTPGNYDESTNSFTPKFIQEARPRFEQPNGDVRFAVVNYFNVLIAFQTFQNEDPLASLMGKILPLIQPETGTPEGIAYFISMVGDMITKLEKLANYRITPQQHKRSPGYTGARGMNDRPSFANQGHARVRKTIELKNFFFSTYDSNISKKYGCDYLTTWTRSDRPTPHSSVSEGETLGFKTLTRERYINRCNREIAKYFTIEGRAHNYGPLGSPIPGDHIESLTYLSPATIVLPTRKNNGAKSFRMNTDSVPRLSRDHRRDVTSLISEESYNIMKSSIIRNNKNKKTSETLFMDPPGELLTETGRRVDERSRGQNLSGGPLQLRKRLESIMSLRGCIVVREDTVIDAMLEQGVEGPGALVDALKDAGAKDVLDLVSGFRDAREINDNVNPNYTFLSLLNAENENSSDLIPGRLGTYRDKFSRKGVKESVRSHLEARGRFEDPDAQANIMISRNMPVQFKSLMVDVSGVLRTRAESLRYLTLPWTEWSIDGEPEGPHAVTGVNIYSNPKYRSVYELEYAMLGKIEYLEGFNKSLLEPTWTVISDLNMLDEASNNKILCRIRKLKDTEFPQIYGFGELSEDYDLPLYNKFFFLTTTARFAEEAQSLLEFRDVESDRIAGIIKQFNDRRRATMSSGPPGAPKKKKKSKFKETRSNPSLTRTINIDWNKTLKTTTQIEKKKLQLATIRQAKYDTNKISAKAGEKQIKKFPLRASSITTVENRGKKSRKARRYLNYDPLAPKTTSLSKKQQSALFKGEKRYKDMIASTEEITQRDKNIIKTQLMGTSTEEPEKFVLSSDGTPPKKRVYPDGRPIPNKLPTHYRESEHISGGDVIHKCGNCAHFKTGDYCSLWNAFARSEYLCDFWAEIENATISDVYAAARNASKFVGNKTEDVEPVPPTNKKPSRTSNLTKKKKLKAKISSTKSSSEGSGTGKGY